MLVESGLVLALEHEKVKSGGGVFTPAACQVSSIPFILYPIFHDCRFSSKQRVKHCSIDLSPPEPRLKLLKSIQKKMNEQQQNDWLNSI
jgi:hypothetical protein